MKIVKNMNEANAPHSCAPPEPSWREEWLPLTDIIQHEPFQVRNKLDYGAISRYREMTAAEQEPPPIRVARVKGALYLVDGWHRMEAGALQRSSDSFTETVLALVADMSEPQARWEAAKANMGHGVRLKTQEYRNVFHAFIHAKRHIKPGGKYMSYREIGKELGKPHRTIHEWTRKDFPGLFKKMGGGHQEAPGGLGDPERPSLEEQHREAACSALVILLQHADALEAPEERGILVEALEGAAKKLRARGTVAPQF